MELKVMKSERMKELADRASHCVCKYCGSPLEVRLVVFGKMEEAGAELYCTNCDRIEYGTEPIIYQQAKYFIESMGFTSDSELEDDQLVKRQSVAKVCEIMMWHDMKLGFLDTTGFKIPVAEEWRELDGIDGSLIYEGDEVSW